MATYSISGSEIRRRVIALTFLIVVWLASQVAISTAFVRNDLLDSAYSLAGLLAVSLVGLWIFTIYFFYERYIHATIAVDKNRITRTMHGHTTTIQLASIARIYIKMTYRGTIREIRLQTRQGEAFVVDGLAQFDEAKNKITSLCPHTKVTTSKEPMDFDHPMFYPILGVVFGVSMNGLILLVSSSPNLFALGATALFAAIFIIFAAQKPLSRQYGHRSKKIDYAFAFVFGVSAVVTLVTSVL